MRLRKFSRPRISKLRVGAALLGAWLTALSWASAADPVATVNGQPIDAADLDFLYLVRKVPPEQRAALRDRFVDDLIDQRLMADFLKSRGVEATAEELDARVAAVRSMLERNGRSADEVLQSLGLNDAALRKTVALPLAWNRHARLAVTDNQLGDYFTAHRARFDGTRRRVSQIVLTLPIHAEETATTAALDQLKTLREEIVAGQITFADAARAHSQSPSKEQGGDMGWEVYGTRMPKEIADVAFQLPLEEVSEPFRSRFGAHLLRVTEEQPGDLSLEDVRGEVLAEMGRNLWAEQLQRQRSAAKIERAQ